MSLIDDALRRIQDPIATTKELPQAPPIQKQPEPPRKEKDSAAHSWKIPSEPYEPTPAKRAAASAKPQSLTWLVVCMAAVAVVSWIIALFWLKPFNFSSPASRQKGAKPGAAQIQPAATEASYKLTGVVVGNGAPFAMIDGKILAAGELVGGAKIVEITESEVRLELPDKTIQVLQVPR